MTENEITEFLKLVPKSITIERDASTNLITLSREWKGNDFHVDMKENSLSADSINAAINNLNGACLYSEFPNAQIELAEFIVDTILKMETFKHMRESFLQLGFTFHNIEVTTEPSLVE